LKIPLNGRKYKASANINVFTIEDELIGCLPLSLPQKIWIASNNVEIKCEARCWWLTPVILATQETEIRRTLVPS
jgi:hypothetical protein